MNIKINLIVIAMVVYNIFLGMYVAKTSTIPTVSVIFISADFLFIFIYLWILARERYKIYKFRKEHSEDIRRAMAEMAPSQSRT